MAKKKEEAEAQGAAVAEGSLLDMVVEETQLKPEDASYGMTKKGLQVFINQMLQGGKQLEKVTTGAIDEMIAELDRKLSAQMDEILHHPDFQKLESAWRGLKYLVDHTDFRENTRIEILSISKSALLEDFEDAPEVVRSGLYRLAYTREYGQFGGQPYGMILGNYNFGPGAQDMQLLQYMASVATMCHAPFISSAGPEFFGIKSYQDLPGLKDLESIFEGPQYAKFRGFRENEDSRMVGLTGPRYLLRLPYGEETVPVKSFDYRENVADSHEQFLWGNSAFAFGSNIHSSFGSYRWCSNIIGPQGGGAVKDLPIYNYESMGATVTKIPTEVNISDRQEFEMSEQGFIGLTMRKGSDNAAFFSANSVQKPKVFANTPEGKQAEMNHKLGTQLPYSFIISRLAHYIKVIQRENIGTWKERADLERELNNWIRQYVADMDNPTAGVRSRRPLRNAEVIVSDVEGDPGWYRVAIKVRPHFKYMGSYFTLSLVGKLDKE